MQDKLITLVFLLLAGLWATNNYWKELSHSQWTPTTCRVEGTTVRYKADTKYDPYILEIHPVWTAGGEEYRPNEPWDWALDQESIDWAVTFETEAESRAVAEEQFPEGGEFLCYANPWEPSERSYGKPSFIQVNSSLSVLVLLVLLAGCSLLSLFFNVLPSRRWINRRGHLTGSIEALGGEEIPEDFTIWPQGHGGYSIADSSTGWVASFFCFVSFIPMFIVYGLVWSGMYVSWCVISVIVLFSLLLLIALLLLLTQLFFEQRILLSDVEIVSETYFVVCLARHVMPLMGIEDCRVLTGEEVDESDVDGLYILQQSGENICIKSGVEPGSWIEGVIKHWISQRNTHRA